MRWVGVEGCCGGRTLKGLGQCRDSRELIPQYLIKQEIQQGIVRFSEANLTFLQATTIKTQHNANKVLTNMGFIGSGWMKRTNCGNEIQMWYLPLGDTTRCAV